MVLVSSFYHHREEMSLSFWFPFGICSFIGIIFIGLSDCISQRRSSSAILLTGMELKAWFIIRIPYRWKSQDQRRCGPDRTAVTVLSAIRHRRIRPARASLNPSFSGRMWRSFQPGLKMRSCSVSFIRNKLQGTVAPEKEH